LWAFALLALPMPGAERDSQTQAGMQQTAKRVTGFEIDSFSVISFHRLRISLSAWHTDGRAWGG